MRASQPTLTDQLTKLFAATLVFVILLGGLVFLGLLKHTTDKAHHVQNNALRTSMDSYLSQLGEKMGIIASSSAFIDYIRSGEISRNKLLIDFEYQIAPLKSQDIIGMKVYGLDPEPIYQYGNESKLVVAGKLCYLNDRLTPTASNCTGEWVVYLEPDALFQYLRSNHPDLKQCTYCQSLAFTSPMIFGHFLTSPKTNLVLKVSMPQYNFWWFIFLFLALVVFVLITSFGVKTYINSLLNNEIFNPINKLSKGLENNEIIQSERIKHESLKQLAKSIQQLKEKVVVAQEAENKRLSSALLERFKSEIRSPITALRITTQSLNHVNEAQIQILNNAIDRIVELANSPIEMNDHEGTNKNIKDPEPGAFEQIQKLVKKIRGSLRHKNIEIYQDFSIAAERSIPLIDVNTLLDVIAQLLENCAYVPSGLGGFIWLRIYLQDECFHIEVESNGASPSLKEQQQLFSSHFATSSSQSHFSYLKNVKHEIESNGGSFLLTSNTEANLIVHLSLPYVRVPLRSLSRPLPTQSLSPSDTGKQ